MMLYTTYESSVRPSFRQEDFWKPIFWPRDLLMQPTGTVWTTLIGDHQGTIPVTFGQNPISGFRGDVVLRKLWWTHGRTDGRRTPDIEGSQKFTEHFVLRWAKNTNGKPIPIIIISYNLSRWSKHVDICAIVIWGFSLTTFPLTSWIR